MKFLRPLFYQLKKESLLGVDHVIWTGHWMLKLVLNIERLLLLCFFLNVVVKCILEHLQDLGKVVEFH